MGLEADRRAESAHGGIVHRSGDMATMGDGSQWWLNGTPWARNEADGAIAANPNRRHVTRGMMPGAIISVSEPIIAVDHPLPARVRAAVQR